MTGTSPSVVRSASLLVVIIEKAMTIIDEVKSAMKSWRSEARRLGLSQRDIDMFAHRFNTL